MFSAKTGVLARTLVGHELGVWAVHLVSRGGSREEAKEARCGEEEEVPGLDHLVPPNLRAALGLDQTHPESEEGPSSDPASSSDEDEDASLGKRSDECNATEGWGQPSALVVSGGCDKVLRVWDVKAGYCIYVLHGHTSTIRCVKVLHNRPIAVSGSRDGTLRVWDVQRGKALRVLQGHAQSVRCLDVCGNKVVSGSYDTTLRVCLHFAVGARTFVLMGFCAAVERRYRRVFTDPAWAFPPNIFRRVRRGAHRFWRARCHCPRMVCENRVRYPSFFIFASIQPIPTIPVNASPS